jgi:hypothetical protein
MTDLDAIVLSHARSEWRKAARFAALTTQDCEIAPTDGNVEVVVARVRAPVDRGQLDGRRDLSLPRFSGV